ncbi:MAG TPA: hypothetical protein VMV72_07735 [Verrucomicrobiae bacterium]|nr:hypothetical protein [Verrucomicrobiae bacterium]
MDYWKADFVQSLQDVMQIVGTSRIFTAIFSLAVIGVTLFALSKVFPKKTVLMKAIETALGLVALWLCISIVFVFCVLFIAPVQIYRDQSRQFDVQTNLVSQLQQQLIQSSQWTQDDLDADSKANKDYFNGMFYRDSKHDLQAALIRFEDAYVCYYRVALRHPEKWSSAAHMAKDVAGIYKMQGRTNDANEVTEAAIAIEDANPTTEATDLYHSLTLRIQQTTLGKQAAGSAP